MLCSSTDSCEGVCFNLQKKITFLSCYDAVLMAALTRSRDFTSHVHVLIITKGFPNLNIK